MGLGKRIWDVIGGGDVTQVSFFGYEYGGPFDNYRSDFFVKTGHGCLILDTTQSISS